MSAEPYITTFYGSDGCGKSSIAAECVNILSNARDKEVIVIGGSSYKEWLTPQLSKQLLGITIKDHYRSETESDREKLYEDIAIACYGYAKILKDNGTHVLIDSDPYLKRLIWSHAGLTDEEYGTYEEQFEERLSAHIGSEMFPDIVVGVNISSPTDIEGAAETFFDRIVERGIVEGYDPSSPAEAMSLANSTSYIWESFVLARKYLRLKNAHILTVQNETQLDENVPHTIKNVAREVITLCDVI